MHYSLLLRSAIVVTDPDRLMRRASITAVRTSHQLPTDTDSAVATLLTQGPDDVLTYPARYGLAVTATATTVTTDRAPAVPESWLLDPTAARIGTPLAHIIDSDHVDHDELDAGNTPEQVLR